MSTTSAHPDPYIVLPADSTPQTPFVPVETALLPEDKLVLYAVLRDLANEIRRIDRERKKHNQKS